MGRDPDVLRSVRFLGEKVCLEVSEMPGRQTVRLELTNPDDADPYSGMLIDLTPTQWRELLALGDYMGAVESDAARPQKPQLVPRPDGDKPVH